MKFVISGKNIDLTPGLQQAVETKLKKLDRYFNAETEAKVTLSVSKAGQKIEVTIPVRGSIIRAEQTSEDMYTSIDLVQDTIVRQMRKYKTKLLNSYKSGGAFSPEYVDEPADDENTIKIVRSKKFAVKPMDPEEACLQMELLGHNFFVFLNSQTEAVNVVYRRNDKSYGLIEPET